MSEEGKVEVIEKRIKPTVIRRRRRVVGPPPGAKEEGRDRAEAKAEEVRKAPERPVSEKRPPERPAEKDKAEPRVVRIPKEKGRPARVVGRIELKETLPPPPQEVRPPEVHPVELEVVPEPVKRKPVIRREEEEEERKPPKRKGRRRREVVTFDEEDLEEVYVGRRVDREYRPEKKRTLGRPALKPQITTPKAIKRKIKVEEEIGVAELAQRMGVKLKELQEKLADLGVEPSPEGTIDIEAAALVASEYGFEVESKLEELEAAIAPQPDPPEKLKPRPPVVTVMGHVDHGKTLLLDAIRQTNVAAKEVGGITQHIGAYKVEVPGKGTITFIDTPGHEAFTAMRARGAQVTDIVVLVVAADDGVMPQTVEAINHAKAAGVPIIVAINKIDKKEANPERVRRQLAEHGLIPEEWGGDTLFAEVSALKKTGIEDLLDLILLQAEMLELKANPSKPARGVIVETRLDRGKGPVATVIVKEGTLKEGDSFVAGLTYGRVRAMEDEWGKRVKEAPPSTPVEVTAFSELPEAGDDFIVVRDERMARSIAELRQKRKARLEGKEVPAAITLEDLFQRIQAGETKELRVVLKADTFGSLQAVKDALEKLSTDEVKVKVIHQGVGAISDSDVNLAIASDAVVIGFNVQPVGKAKALISERKVDVRTYKIIYELIEDVQRALKGMLAPEKKEVVLGRAEVRAVFRIPRVGAVAGCYVQEGRIVRGASVRVLRGEEVVHEGKISSLKRFKEDVKEVQAGYECGVGVEGFGDWREGDRIEAYTVEEVAPQ